MTATAAPSAAVKPIHADYPSPAEVDAWCDALLAKAQASSFQAELSGGPASSFAVRNAAAAEFVRFSRPGAADWYGIWQPVHSGGPAPLLVHVPGYGAEMSVHPHLVAAGFNVLHVSPQGYCTPQGLDVSKQVNQCWPVLPDTVSTGGQRGYVDWLADVLVAVRWARQQPQVQADRLATFGTSQGGGTALLLASLLRDGGIKACCADVPFLTGFPMVFGRENPGAYCIAFNALPEFKADAARTRAAWRAMGLIDTISHAHRLTMPTLLLSGAADPVCPADTIRALFDRLPGTRSYVELAGQGHAYTVPFGELLRAWCAIYV